jgi:hypothetical protein
MMNSGSISAPAVLLCQPHSGVALLNPRSQPLIQRPIKRISTTLVRLRRDMLRLKTVTIPNLSVTSVPSSQIRPLQNQTLIQSINHCQLRMMITLSLSATKNSVHRIYSLRSSMTQKNPLALIPPLPTTSSVVRPTHLTLSASVSSYHTYLPLTSSPYSPSSVKPIPVSPLSQKRYYKR